MSEPRMDRVLGLAGALGGLFWAAIPVVAAISFYGLESGVLGLGHLGALGALFQFAGLSVLGLLAGTVGLYHRIPARAERWGRRGAVTVGAGFVLLLPGSVVANGSLPAAIGRLVPLVFFAGLLAVAVGSLGVGLAVRRAGSWPPGLAVGFGLSTPVGAALGGLVALDGAGNLALVLGLMVPYGLVWIGLGAAMATGAV